MRYKRIIRGLLVAAIVLTSVLISGCVNEECLDNQNALPLAGFYASAPRTEPISLDSITLRGWNAPGDSLLLDNARGVSEAYMPFRIDQDETTFILQYNQKQFAERGIYDEITFIYDIEPVFVSAACGVSYRFTIRDIEHTDWLIDSVTCPEGVIDNANLQNIRIYFRVAQ